MSEIRVSVLVPSYNHGRYLEERIQSIVNQTYKNIELIVIDDCSEDNSDEIIARLQHQYGFNYVRNKSNSGTPFAAWSKIADLARGDYIWICESDDVAEPEFLTSALAAFQSEPAAVLFYSSSNVIDEKSTVIGHTDSFFHDIWKETRWDQSFVASGVDELVRYQLRGQTVPNMSSALIKTGAFKKAFDSYLLRFRLTGDWLFIGNVLKHGKVIYCRDTLSNFRKHAVTSRERVKSARSQAEFILTKYKLFQGASQPIAAFARVMGTDAIRFLYEPASVWEVLKALFQISWFDTLKCTGLLVASIFGNPGFLKKFVARYKHAKEINSL